MIKIFLIMWALTPTGWQPTLYVDEASSLPACATVALALMNDPNWPETSALTCESVTET